MESGQAGVPEAGRIEEQGGPSGSGGRHPEQGERTGRHPRPMSAPAPGQALPRPLCDSLAVPTPSLSASSGRRGPALLSRATDSDSLLVLGIGSLRGVCQQQRREGKGGKVLRAEGEICTPHPRGWRRTSLQRSAQGERVAGRQRRGGHWTRRRRRTGRAQAASEGIPAVSGPSRSPRRGRARRPPLPGQPPPREILGRRRASYDSLKLSRSPLHPLPGRCL